MTEIPQDFSTPSEVGKWPTLKQLAAGNALIAVKPTRTQHDVPDTFNPGKTKTMCTCTVTVLQLDAPISVVLDQHGQIKAQLEAPVQVGTEMIGFPISQPGIVRDIEDRESDRSWPGVLGTIGTYPTAKGNPGWKLVAPTPDQLAVAQQWLKWKRGQSTPAPQVAPVSTAPAPAAPAPATPPPVQQQPAAAPWTAAPAAAAAAPPWAQ